MQHNPQSTVRSSGGMCVEAWLKSDVRGYLFIPGRGIVNGGLIRPD